MTMFTSLLTLLSQSDSLVVTMTAQADVITATVMPKPKAGQDSSLAQPLQLTGTAAELDEGFAAAVSSFSTKRLSLVEQVEAANAIIEASKKAVATKAANAGKKGPQAKGGTFSAGGTASTSTASGLPEDDDDEDEESDSSRADNGSPISTAAPASAGGNTALANIFA